MHFLWIAVIITDALGLGPAYRVLQARKAHFTLVPPPVCRSAEAAPRQVITEDWAQFSELAI